MYLQKHTHCQVSQHEFESKANDLKHIRGAYVSAVYKPEKLETNGKRSTKFRLKEAKTNEEYRACLQLIQRKRN